MYQSPTCFKSFHLLQWSEGEIFWSWDRSLLLPLNGYLLVFLLDHQKANMSSILLKWDGLREVESVEIITFYQHGIAIHFSWKLLSFYPCFHQFHPFSLFQLPSKRHATQQPGDLWFCTDESQLVGKERTGFAPTPVKKLGFHWVFGGFLSQLLGKNGRT